MIVNLKQNKLTFAVKFKKASKNFLSKLTTKPQKISKREKIKEMQFNIS